jgi:hypothetical protein
MPKDTFIFRDNSDNTGFEVCEKLLGGNAYRYSLRVDGPISGHYAIQHAIFGGSNLNLFSCVGIKHSKKKAFDKAYNILYKNHKNCTIIDKTSRAKESKLAQK